MELFKCIKEAIEALKECCEWERSPIAKSEVYNETWMLRLTLACIHDSDKFTCGSENVEVLNDIRKAVKIRWVSEGGLCPTLEKEGPTWTDAIIGGISINGDNEIEDFSGRKRGVGLTAGRDCGVIVIEAKIGSKLASRTTHHPKYNQAARNIACLAKLVTDDGRKFDEEFVGKCRFIVFAPSQKVGSWGGVPLNGKWLTDEYGVIEEFKSKLRIRKDDEAELHVDNFLNAAKSIAENSKIITWDEACKLLNNEYVATFYERCKEEGDREYNSKA